MIDINVTNPLPPNKVLIILLWKSVSLLFILEKEKNKLFCPFYLDYLDGGEKKKKKREKFLNFSLIFWYVNL